MLEIFGQSPCSPGASFGFSSTGRGAISYFTPEIPKDKGGREGSQKRPGAASQEHPRARPGHPATERRRHSPALRAQSAREHPEPRGGHGLSGRQSAASGRVPLRGPARCVQRKGPTVLSLRTPAFRARRAGLRLAPPPACPALHVPAAHGHAPGASHLAPCGSLPSAWPAAATVASSARQWAQPRWPPP